MGLSNAPEGYKNWLLNKNKELAKERLEICNSCENRTIMHTCSICGCLLEAKVRTKKEKCPINKW